VSAFPLKAFQDSLSSLQKVWHLERELIRLKAQAEFRQRALRIVGVLSAAFLVMSGIGLAFFWASVGILQAGRPLWQVVVLSSGPLLALAFLVFMFSRRHGL
jgi:hypothetical protein